MVDIIIYTFLVGVCGTGLGGVVGALFKKDSNATMSLLLSFAGGVMLSIVCFDLLSSSIESSNVFVAVAFVVIGIALVFLLNLILDRISAKNNTHLDENHPKTHDDLDELIHSEALTNPGNTSLLRAGVIMVLAIAFHNLPEGLSIGSSYAHEVNNGLFLAFIIALHNIPEGMAIVVPLISGGMNRLKAVLLTALSGFPTMIGAVLGYLLGGIGDMGLAISLALASGAMLYVVFGEIIPQSILMYKSKLPAFFIMFGILLGVLLIYAI